MSKIYVGNLPFSATEDAVRALFAQHGTWNPALPTDRDAGRSAASGSSRCRGRMLRVRFRVSTVRRWTAVHAEGQRGAGQARAAAVVVVVVVVASASLLR